MHVIYRHRIAPQPYAKEDSRGQITGVAFKLMDCVTLSVY